MINKNYFQYCKWTKLLILLKRPVIKNLYRGVIPKKYRKRLEFFIDQRQQEYTSQNFRSFIELYFDGELLEFNLKPLKRELVGKKIIWQYWGQGIGNAPRIVQVCFNSVDEFKEEYEIIRLDDSNLSEYLEFPQFIVDKKTSNSQFKYAFFADLIRIALLDVYGGIWLDATMLLTGKIPNKLLGMDYFMFQRSLNTLDKDKWIKYDSAYFGWKSSHKVNVLNSFIIAKHNNYVIHTLFELLMNFWYSQENIPHYFFFQIMYHELLQNELKEYSCEVIDDTLPHHLHYKLNHRFDDEQFLSIKEVTTIHKLRYINKSVSNSFYEYLIDKNL